MKNLFKVLLFLLLPLFSLLLLIYPQESQAAHGGCHLFVSTTSIAPHGGFNVTVSNGTPGLEYIVVYDASFYSTVFIMPASGSFTTFVDVDDIFGSTSPQAVSGTFDIIAGTTYPLGFPDHEVCEPQKITMEVTGPIPPTANIRANGSDGPITIPYNTSATVSWTSTDATSCTVNPGGFSGTNGSQSTGNLTSSRTYTLTCNGAAGTSPATDSVTINTTAPPTPTPTPSPTPSPTPTPIPSPTPTPTSCTISPSSVSPGGSFTLTANGLSPGSSYPIRRVTGFGSSPVSMGTLTSSPQTVNVASNTGAGLYAIRIITGPNPDVNFIQCTPGLDVQPSPPSSCTISPSNIRAPGSFYLTANGYSSGQSYPVVLKTGFGTDPTSLGNLTNPTQAFNVPSKNPGTYAVFLTISPGNDLRCSPNLIIEPPPPTSCTISPSSILAPGSFYLTATGYSPGTSYEVRRVTGFGTNPIKLGDLTNATQAFDINQNTNEGIYAVLVITGPNPDVDFVRCTPDLNVEDATPDPMCPGFMGYSPDPPVLEERVWVMFLGTEGDPEGSYWLAWSQPNSGERSALPLYIDRTTASSFGAWIVTLNGLDEQTDWQLAQTMPDGTNVPCASGSLYPGVTGELTETCGWLRFPSPGNEVVVGPIKNCDLTTPGGILSAVLPIIFGLAGFLSVIMIVIAGIQFISSSGNPEAAASARNRLIFALVGFGLIILAFAILQIVDKYFLGGSGIV